MIDDEFDDSVSLVSISRVDTKNLVFEGRAVIDRPKQVRLTILPGTTWVIPKEGEQWLVKRNGRYWHLLCKTDYQDQRRLLPQTEGMYAYGGTGETHILGSDIILHGNVRVEGSFDVGEKDPLPDVLDSDDPNAIEKKPEEHQEQSFSISPQNFTVGSSFPKNAKVSLPAGRFSVVTLVGRFTSVSATTLLNIKVGEETKSVSLLSNTQGDLSETFFFKPGSSTSVSLTTRASAVNLTGVRLRVVQF